MLGRFSACALLVGVTLRVARFFSVVSQPARNAAVPQPTVFKKSRRSIMRPFEMMIVDD
jgi:hypothetical protein